MADTNEHDGWAFRTLRKMETDLGELEEKHMKYLHKEETRALREERRALGEELRSLEDEVTILSPLKVFAVRIRERFFTFQSGELVGEIEDPSEIWIGSDIVPAGDVITDVCMFKNELLHYNGMFTALYGLDWQAAQELIGHLHMVSAMDKRATILAAASTEWTKEWEFNQLLRWTQNATPEELVDFTKDVVGVTYPKRLFLDIMRDS